MDNVLDIQKYFDRIGFKKEALPNYETLKEIHTLHTLTIPFENLNPLLQIPVSLDLDSIQKKMIQHKRGGYCFEQNILFKKVLETIGFEVTSHSGRVLLNKHETTITPKTHLLLIVHLSGKKYIIDVGFGGQSPCEPLLFEFDQVQETIHGNYRILEREGYFLLQAAIRHRWTNLYRFSSRETHFSDHKIANWFTSTHPDSHFTYRLTIAMAGKDCRYVFNNNHYKIYYQDGTSKKQILASSEEVIQTLEEVFGIDTSSLFNLKERLDNVFGLKKQKV